MRNGFFIFALLSCLVCSLTACQTQPPASDPSAAADQQTEAEQAETQIKTAKINAQLGLAYLERQDVMRAKQKLLLALSQAPDIPEPWYSMAYFQEATGNLSEANKDYIKAIQIAPERGEAQNNYGTFLCRHGQYQTAIQHFLVAVKDNNYLTPANAYENAGLCSLKIGAYPAAARYFKQALREDPNHTTSLKELAQLKAKNLITA